METFVVGMIGPWGQDVIRMRGLAGNREKVEQAKRDFDETGQRGTIAVADSVEDLPWRIVIACIMDNLKGDFDFEDGDVESLAGEAHDWEDVKSLLGVND